MTCRFLSSHDVCVCVCVWMDEGREGERDKSTMGDILVPTSKGWVVRHVAVMPSGFERVEGMCPAARASARVLNACGELVGAVVCRTPTHPGWRKRTTRFGTEHQAYTVGGNLSIQVQRVVFKGAVNERSLVRVAIPLLSGVMEMGGEGMGPTPRLQLMVLQASIGRSLCVQVGCLLERQLEEDGPYGGWVRMCSRCEELCNVVAFTVVDWDRALEALGMTAGMMEGLQAPDSAMASVTRRGVMTLRLTWGEGVEWSTSAPLTRFTDLLAGLLHDLV